MYHDVKFIIFFIMEDNLEVFLISVFMFFTEISLQVHFIGKVKNSWEYFLYITSCRSF